ncbi:MAG: periplasmic heavy metal sensor [bacterium]
MKKNLSILLGLLVLVSYGFAQEFHTQKKFQQEMMQDKEPMMRMQMLDLSDEQRGEIENSKYELEKKTIQLRADIQLKHLDLQREMKADNLNRSKLMNLTQDISNLELKIKQLKIDQKLKIHSILTPEQRLQLKDQPRKVMIKKEIIKKNCEGNCQD